MRIVGLESLVVFIVWTHDNPLRRVSWVQDLRRILTDLGLLLSGLTLRFFLKVTKTSLWNRLELDTDVLRWIGTIRRASRVM